MAKLMEVVSLPMSNEHLLEPYKIGEKVLFVGILDKSVQPDTFRRQFIRVKRLKSKRIEHVAKKHFKFLKKKK